MVVSAEASLDLDGQGSFLSLESAYREILREISIQPLNHAGSVVEIKIPYHERQPINPKMKIWNPTGLISVSLSRPGNIIPPLDSSLHFLLITRQGPMMRRSRSWRSATAWEKVSFEITDWNGFFQTDRSGNRIQTGQYSEKSVQPE